MKVVQVVSGLILAASVQTVCAEVQTCKGDNSFLAPKKAFSLTCNVTSPLGGDKMLILPEMWVPGNGCIVTTTKPKVVMVGNNFGVTATFTNRCVGSQKKSEGGLAWEIIQLP